jgi:hypothetical protein
VKIVLQEELKNITLSGEIPANSKIGGLTGFARIMPCQRANFSYAKLMLSVFRTIKTKSKWPG